MKLRILHVWAGWSLLLSCSLLLSVNEMVQGSLNNLRTQARVSLEREWLFRKWNAASGGVYVPVSPETQPNPHLTSVPEREVTTPSGRILTLVNPAYMSRLANALQTPDGIRIRLTGLKPLRPENFPDSWESDNLNTLSKRPLPDNELPSEIRQIGNTFQLRMLKPLKAEPACLKCHSSQGFREGDLLGALSTSIPVTAELNAATHRFLFIGLVHFIIWSVGILGIRQAWKIFQEDERKLYNASRLASLGTLAAGIGHEINNPLAIISGNVSIIKNRLKEPSTTADFDKPIDRIQTAIERISSIVKGVRTFAKKDSASLGPTDLHFAVQGALGLTQDACKSAGVTLHVDLRAHSAMMQGNSTQLQQVIVQLIQNALEATERAKEPEIRLETFNEGGLLTFRISDNGNGIDPAHLPHIFDPFFSTKTTDLKTGMGLSMCLSIVESMKGTIEVQSTHGHGASFVLRFPT